MVLRRRFKKKKSQKVVSRPVRIYTEPIVIKAVVLLLKEQLNLLRSEHGLPEITNAQALAAVKDKVRQLAEAKRMHLKWLGEIDGG